MRWVRTILSQSRFDDSIFLSGGLAHWRSGGLQVGKVRTGKCAPRMGQVGNQAPRACSRKGRGFGEPYAGRRGAPGLTRSMKEKEEESGVVAQSLKALLNPMPPGIRELDGLLYHQASCGPVLLSQLLKTGPCEWIGNGRDLGLLSQDQVIELFVLRMCYLWTFQHLGHEARGLCQIPSSPPPLLYNKIRIFCRWLHPQTPTTNIRMDY